MIDPPNTAARQLIRAAEIGAEEGLRFVYAGNLPGRVGPWENTYCPNCREILIDRFGYLVREYKITADAKCPRCQASLDAGYVLRKGSERERRKPGSCRDIQHFVRRLAGRVFQHPAP